jgi:uncharacterized protein (DUF924 family)
MSGDELQALLDFWFGATGTEGCDEPRTLWFKSTPAHDAELRWRFGALHESAASGALDDWAGSADGALALVLLLDQLPRNLHRGTARAYACDAKARAVAGLALSRGSDIGLAPVRRLFLYLPFEHSERLADQEESLRLFATLPEGSKRSAWLKSAQRHHAVVARFGRFPHRNGELGRASTQEEEEFLRGPDAPY